MARQVYLIPFADPPPPGFVAGPKYMNLIPAPAHALIPEETTVDQRERTWRTHYFLVSIDVKDPKVVEDLEKQADVIRVDSEIASKLSSLSTIGVSVTDLSIASTAEAVQRRVTAFLDGSPRTFLEARMV